MKLFFCTCTSSRSPCKKESYNIKFSFLFKKFFFCFIAPVDVVKCEKKVFKRKTFFLPFDGYHHHTSTTIAAAYWNLFPSLSQVVRLLFAFGRVMVRTGRGVARLLPFGGVQKGHSYPMQRHKKCTVHLIHRAKGGGTDWWNLRRPVTDLQGELLRLINKSEITWFRGGQRKKKSQQSGMTFLYSTNIIRSNIIDQMQIPVVAYCDFPVWIC